MSKYMDIIWYSSYLLDIFIYIIFDHLSCHLLSDTFWRWFCDFFDSFFFYVKNEKLPKNYVKKKTVKSLAHPVFNYIINIYIEFEVVIIFFFFRITYEINNRKISTLFIGYLLQIPNKNMRWYFISYHMIF